jgi:hypothetical protein
VDCHLTPSPREVKAGSESGKEEINLFVASTDPEKENHGDIPYRRSMAPMYSAELSREHKAVHSLWNMHKPSSADRTRRGVVNSERAMRRGICFSIYAVHDSTLQRTPRLTLQPSSYPSPASIPLLVLPHPTASHTSRITDPTRQPFSPFP